MTCCAATRDFRICCAEWGYPNKRELAYPFPTPLINRGCPTLRLVHLWDTCRLNRRATALAQRGTFARKAVYSVPKLRASVGSSIGDYKEVECQPHGKLCQSGIVSTRGSPHAGVP